MPRPRGGDERDDTEVAEDAGLSRLADVPASDPAPHVVLVQNGTGVVVLRCESCGADEVLIPDLAMVPQVRLTNREHARCRGQR